MIRRFRFDGGATPFEGRREVLWRRLPAGAEIASARATVTPVAAGEGGEPFIERIDFAGSRGDWGATKQAVPGNWVEVDFHARRTLVSVTGSGLVGGAGNAQLLVDLGGVFHRVNADGSLGGSANEAFRVAADSAPLPGLAVTRFRLVRSGFDPDVASVRVASVPTNVSLALGELPPFWTRPGELAAAETTPDFAAVLQAVLAEAEVEHGFYALPLVVRSDTIARLTVELEIDFAVTAAALPAGLDEASLSYDFGGVPKGGVSLPALAIPAGSRVCATRGRAVGAFAASRVVLGPTGAVSPAGSVEISPAATQARLLALDAAAGAGAVDLLLSAVDRTVDLELDVREDLDGKPGGRSLLGATVPFRLDRASAGGPTWVSVPLPRELQLPAGRVWLVVQSTAGTAAWHVAAGGPAMQRTTDGGLSWRRSPAAGAGGPVDRPAGHFRLRRTGGRFTMPIELQIGDERVSLERFAPLGRVEVALDVPEVAAAINRALARSAPIPCPEVEHLADGDFSRWIGLGDEPTPGFDVPLGSATAFASAALLALAADGRRAFVATGGGDAPAAQLHVVELGCGGEVAAIALPTGGTPLALAVDPAGALGFVAFEGDPALHLIDLAGRRLLGGAVTLPFGPSALAVSEDGERLFMGYAAASATGAAAGGDAGVAAVAVARLAAVASGGAGGRLAEGDVEDLPLGSGRPPRALAAAGGRLYALVGDEPGAGEFVRLVVRPLGADPAATDVTGGTALAVTRGGELALVARARGVDAAGVTVAPALAILDARSGRRLGEVPLRIEPRSVAAAADGHRAFVAGSGGLAVVDLRRRREVTVLRAEQDLAAVAVASEGERVFATRLVVEDSVALAVMPVGVPAPAEWALLGGRAAPVCLGRPARPAVVLGDPTGKQPAATTLAQVTPASGGCRYELSFAGLASEEDARVEVVWRGDGCAALGRDAVPIRLVEEQPAFSVARQPVGLAAHQERFAAPPGATQAEVRIEVPFGFAALQALSLRATVEAVDNADLRLTSEDGSPRGWLAGAAGASTLLAGAAGGRLANPGGREVSLVQVVPAQASGRFALELEAAPVMTGDGPAGRLDLTWLGSEGENLGESVTLEVAPAAFDLQAAAGEVVAGAVEARLELSVAPGAAIDVRRVSLRIDRPAELPVTFVAQAPGELTVTGWQVCHEPIEPRAPAVPATGLCAPAPAAGEKGGEGECFCSRCGSRRKIQGTTAAITGAGRPAAVGTCSGCGAPAVGFGGRPVPGAGPLPVLASPPARRLEPAVLFARRAAGPATSTPAAEAAPITAVIGIGRARAQELAAIGVDSLARLSFASPERLAAALRGVSPVLAADFIRQARRLLAPR